MRAYDEVRSRIDSLEAALEALQNEGFQDDEEAQLATLCVGALDWATDKATPAAQRFLNLCNRFDVHLKRLERKPTKRRKVLRINADGSWEHCTKDTAAPTGDPW